MIFIVTKKKLFQSFFFLFSFCILAKGAISYYGRAHTVNAPAQNKCYLAIVIDDFGYHGEGTDEMLSLEIPFTAALMPFSDSTKEDMEQIHTAGKEIIIHMPMESLTGKKSWVGDKAVFTNMSAQDINNTVNEALTIVPYAVGINNHMGSAVMEDEKSLAAVLDVVQEKGLLFVDSKTTASNNAQTLCGQKNIPLLKRDVFLDSTDDIEVVKNRLKESAEIALSQGYCLSIGHVGPEGGKITAQAIKEMAPQLEKEGIEFVTVSQLKEILKAKEVQQ